MALVQVDAENASLGLYCAGIWVAPNLILTAAHCVSSAGEPEWKMLLDSVGFEQNWDPTGQPIFFSEKQDWDKSFRDAKVAKYKAGLDLALLEAISTIDEHPFARLRTYEISLGEDIEVIGHPRANYWSYARGYVSAIYPDKLSLDEETPAYTLEIAAPISRGNSGGGAFDLEGNLVGVASYIEKNLNGMGFFIGGPDLRKFLYP